MRTLIAIIPLLLVSVAISQKPQPEAGMYVDQQGALAKLETAPHPNVQAKSKFVKETVSWVFRGAQAAAQFSTSRPNFVLYGSSERFVIVQLDRKSDHRELQVASGSMFGGHGGWDEKRTTLTLASKRQDGGLDLSPEKDLEPGEYLITTETAPRQAYDFGIQPEPKQ